MLQSLAIPKQYAILIAQFIALLGMAVVAPLFHFQAITGPIVNAALFLAVIWLGPSSAIMLGLLPCLIALSVGLLPSPLAPAVPFIMVSNAILIVTFEILRRKSYWAGVLAGSFLKFCFLFSVNSLVANLLLKKELAPKLAQMLSWPQLVTALAGGALAYLILEASKKIVPRDSLFRSE